MLSGKDSRRSLISTEKTHIYDINLVHIGKDWLTEQEDAHASEKSSPKSPPSILNIRRENHILNNRPADDRPLNL